MAKFDKRLKNILVKRGCLTVKAAEDALVSAEREGRSLSQVLVDQKLLAERDLISAVAVEMRMPPIDVHRVQIEESVLEALPQDLAKYYGVLPIAKIGDILTLAVSNPFDILKLDDIRIVTGCNIRPVVSTEMSIQSAIAKAYDKSAQKLEELYGDLADPEVELAREPNEAEETDDAAARDEKSPVVKLVNLLIMNAVKERASDIHIEPMEKKLRIRLRKDGVLHEFPTAPHKKYQNAITSRIKIMASLDIAEKRIPQDGKFQMRIEGRPIDFRVSILPTLFGEKTVLRILDSSNLALSLDTLGFEPQALEAFQRALSAPYGMVLVTGPTGSGKTTTLYSSLREVMTVEDNVVTVEDPVEYQLDGVIQVPVNPKRGMTFAAALRSILRQDPDTVMIGEMRDLETIEIAIRAALTGHLVLSTLHTNDAASTITRMIDMGVDPFLVTSTVILASAQRLLRKVCQECKEEAHYPPERLLEIGYTEAEVEARPMFFRGRGCQRCNNGYKGRFAILEALTMTDKLKRLVLDGQSDVHIKRAAVEEGMITLRRCGLLNALRGRTSIEEVLRMTSDDFLKAKAGFAGKHAEALEEDVRP
jgi:type IV pilus assembly protein PilB